MKRRATLMLLAALPLIALLAASCASQSTSQNQTQPAQLSPEDQARQTVTDFLEMCKQGRVQEAIDTYGAEHLQLRLSPPPVISIDPPGLENLVDYTVEGITTIQQNYSEVLAVMTELRCNVTITGAINTTTCIFQMMEDGKFILYNDPGIKLSAPDRAKLTVAGFLEMCKQGQVQEAIDKYRDATSAFSPQDIGFLQNIVDYSMRDATLEASPTPPPYIVVALDVTVRQESISGEAGPEIRCSQDGRHVLGGVEYSIQ